MSEANVKGLSELQAFLDQLPAKMEQNIMRAALRQGANVMRDEVKSSAPFKTGLLRDGLKVSTRSKRGVVTASVKAKGKHGFIARWLEYGTAAHKILPKSKKSIFFNGVFSEGVDHPGINAKPFMRPALSSKSSEALMAVGETIKKRLTKQGLDASGVDLEGS